MPQPLSYAAKGAGLIVDYDALRQRPQLAPFIAQTIAAWANTELTLGNLLARMLGIGAQAGIAMYSALDAFQPQMRALDAAAARFFEPDDKDIYDATMIVIRRAASQRHAFAHGIWGICPELPDALLLAKPSDLWHWSAQMTEWATKMRETAYPRATSDFSFDNSRVLVYWEKDFRSSLDRVRKSTRYAVLLAQLVPSIPAVAGSIRRQLCSVPEIRSALDRSNPPRTKQTSALPREPDTTDVY